MLQLVLARQLTEGTANPGNEHQSDAALKVLGEIQKIVEACDEMVMEKPDCWKNYCTHVITEEKKIIEAELFVENHIEPFIISVNAEGSSSSEPETDEDDICNYTVYTRTYILHF